MEKTTGPGGPRITLKKGPITIEGNFYSGVACTGRHGADFILIAQDEDCLEKIWNKIMAVKMNRAKCRKVIVARSEEAS